MNVCGGCQAWGANPRAVEGRCKDCGRAVVALTDEEIRMLASGLSTECWAWDTSPPGRPPIGVHVDAMRLCQRLEAMLPADEKRVDWPDNVKEAAKL